MKVQRRVGAWLTGAAAVAAAARSPAARPPRRWSGRQAGLRAFEWVPHPACVPFPRLHAQWAPSTTSGDASFTRLPLRGQRRCWTGFPFSLSLRSRDHLSVLAR